MVTAVVPDDELGCERADLMAGLDAAGIDTRPFFHPLSSLPALRRLPEATIARERNVVSYALDGRGLNLPSALSLQEDDVDVVCSAFLALLGVA